MDGMDITSGNIQQALDVAALRQRVIVANIANVSTPGYKAKNVSFDQALGEAVTEEREGVTPREDGNTVVMELEVADMRKNQVAYDLLLTAMNQRLRLVRSAISGRGQ
jgi:flagellar basal-body rod protein FlgB